MRESNFIRQNKKKWASFEQILKLDKKDPDKLSRLFVQITDDLSYARTFYPNRSVRVYLNSLAQRVWGSIYRNRRPQMSRLIRFWANDLPQVCFQERKNFLLAFTVFLFFVAVGVLSTVYDPDFPRVILGDYYVDQTLENIERGEPMAVYQDEGGDQFWTFLHFILNNVRVAFLAFVLGALFSVGTYFVLMINGVMLGAFQYFFFYHGVGMESVLTIWIHGTMEILSIVLGGAAGITMGNGLAFPGTYSRLQSFVLSAKRGIMIMMGITPIIMFAAFLEAYVTGLTDAPNVLKASILIGSLLFMVGYFVWLPWVKARRGWKYPLKEIRLPPDRKVKINYPRARSNGNIFSEAFVLYKKYFGRIFWWAIGVSLLFTAGFYWFIYRDAEYYFYLNDGDAFMFWYNLTSFFRWVDGWWFVFLLGGALVIMGLYVLYNTVEDSRDSDEKAPAWSKKLGWFFLVGIPQFSIMVGAMFIPQLLDTEFWLWYLALWFLFPLFVLLCTLWAFVTFRERVDLFTGLFKTFGLLGGFLSRPMGLSLMVGFLSFLIILLVTSPMGLFYYQLISSTVYFEFETLNIVFAHFFAFLLILTITLAYPLFVCSSALLYYSLREMKDAATLKERIKKIGV